MDAGNGKARKTILLVDDEAIIALAEAGMLEKHGFKVLTAVSGEEAVSKVRAGDRIDLVLMDIDLGRGMDGTEAAKIIIQKRGIPVLFLSSHTEREVVEKTENITSYGYVVKNSGETVLLASIKMAFRLHEANTRLIHTSEEIKASNEEFQAALEELESSNEELMRSQNELQESETYQRQIIDNTPFGAHFYRLENDGRLIFTGANKAADRILKIDHRPLSNKTIEEAFPGLVGTDIPPAYKEIAAKGTTYEQDQVQYNEGSIVGAYAINAFQTAPNRMAVFFTDITERKRDREELERYFNSSLDLLCIADTEGNFRRLNPEWEKTLGYRLEELEGKKFLDFVHPDDMQSTLAAVSDLASQKEVLNFTNRYRAKDGSYRWIEWRSLPAGKLIYAAARDITERIRIERELRESEEKIKSIILAAPTGIGFTVNRVLQEVNDRLCEMTGYSREELIGSSARMLYPTQEEYEFVGREKYRQIAETGTGTVETLWRSRNGKILDILLSSTPLDRNDLSKGVTFTALDITMRRFTEEALRESEEKFRFLAEKMGDVVWTLDLGLRTTYVSPSVVKVLGFTQEERKRQSLEEIMTPESRAKVLEVLGRELEREKEAGIDPDRITTMEVEYHHKNGSTVWLENSMKALRDSQGALIGVYGVSRDISERKRAEAAQRESEERFTAFMNYLPGMVLIKDGELKPVYANRRFRDLFPADEWMGKTPGETFPPEIAEPMADNDRKALKDGDIRYEEQWKGSDGAEYFLETNKFRIEREGKDPYLGAIIMDITERKRAEASLEAALEEKNALFRELQHRVKNSLTMITSLVGLESEQARDAATKEALENLRGRINTLSNLYAMLYSGGETKDIRLDRYLQAIARSLMDAYMQGDKRVDLRLSLEDISIDAKKASSYGLILNELVTNALKYAFPADRRGIIEVVLEIRNGETVLEVADDGAGLPADFNMENSRGLGLMLVRMLARQLDGTVQCAVGGKTRFIVRTGTQQQ